MRACEHCREHLFDYVYGLADESEALDLRAHLDQCPQCQAELETARTQQKLLAQAARAISVVPEFVLPSDITAASSSPQATQELAGSQTPATLPMPAPRRGWRRAWVVVACTSAAAVLLIVGIVSVQHNHAINELQNDLTAKRREYQSIDKRFAALPAKHVDLQKAVIADTRAQAPAHLHVLGPAHLEPGAKANVHVTLRNVEGQLARDRVVVKLVDETTKRIVQETPVDVNGQSRVEIESATVAPNSKLAVIVEAGRVSVNDTIQIAAPTFATRIDTNKNAYQVSEVLFFRALVLDRWSLKPPVVPVTLEVTLVNPKNETVAQFKQTTEAGGILAGELPIAASFLAGNYVLAVRPINGARVQPGAQRLEIVRDVPTPDIEFNQQRYLPGDVVSGGVFVPGGQPTPKSGTATIDGKSVPVTIDPQPTFAAPAFRGAQAVPGGVGANVGKTDAKKQAVAARPIQRFAFTAPLPKQLPEGARQLPLKLEFENGTDKKAYNALVAIEPTDYAIDLFPEGGDLIAGVPNHVFFRVRSKTGEPVTGAGSVILLSSKNEIVDAPYQLGLGSFEFTPELKEAYTIRITSPVKTSEVAQPFAKLGIRTAGVVLHVPHAVGKQGEPIEVTLRNQGPPRKLLLVAQCRGQIVDQRWLDVKAGSKGCRLETTSQARGMIRVTAYEADGDTLQPVAERLVYRAAAVSLNLGVNFNTQQFGAGQALKGQLSARDETGKDTAAWILASVVDERFQSKPRSLSAHFMLMNEMRSTSASAGDSHIDNAQVILHDTPEAVQVLERFLGTHGWRRFVGTHPAPLTAESGVFSRENMPLSTLQKQHEDKLAAAVAPLLTAAFTEHGKLALERLHSANTVKAAAGELARLEGRIPPWRLAFGLVLVCLLAASVIQLGVGVYRIIRQHRAATPSFGGAFACLSICLVMMFVGSAIAPTEPSNTTNLPAGRVAWDDVVKLEGRLAQPSLRRARSETTPVGALAMLAPHDAPAAEEKSKADRRSQEGDLARENALRGFTAHAGGFGGNTARRNESPAMIARLKELQQGKGAQPAPLIAPTTPVAKAKKSPAIAKSPEREFAPKHAPDLSADTLLWSPTLWLPDGAGEVRFDIASGQATYRVLLLGHSPTGRVGSFETRLDVPAMGR